MMKKSLVLICLALTMVKTQSQILKPVKWSTSVEKVSDTESVLIATATIDAHWHLYSQNVPEDGPVATLFTYKGNGNYLKKGNTTEEVGHVVDDPVFGMKIKYFADKTVFKQRIRTKTSEKFNVDATVEFMVCDDEKCLPPTEVDLVFNVN